MSRWVRGFLLIFVLCVIPVLCQDAVPDYGYYDPALIYNLAPGKNIIVEMPEGTDFTYKVITTGAWETDDMSHFIWIQAKEKTEPCKIRITRKNDKKGIELSLYCQEGARETPFKIIIRDSDFEKLPEDVRQPNYVAEIKSADQAKEKKPEDQKDVKDEKRTEVQLGLMGGLYGVGPKKNFNVAGDFALAAKFFGGVHVQSSFKIDWNGWIKCFGQSIGLGIEPPEKVPFGLFVFLDTLEWKIQDYVTTFHAQVRPSIRLRFNLVHISAWYAVPVTDDRMVAEDAVDDDYAIYNSQIPHFGFDVLAQFGKKMRLSVDGLIGSSSLFRVGGNLEFKLSRNFRVIGAAHVGSFGKYPLLLDEELDNSLTASLGLRFIPGKADFDTLKSRMIYPPDYPIVTSKRHKKEDDKNQSTKPLWITLDADPKQGYVPLAVSFTERFGGGKEPYNVVLEPAHDFQPITSTNLASSPPTRVGLESNRMFVYTIPGIYTAIATITDATGKKVESNEVFITALPATSQYWNIVVYAGSGGKVSPTSAQVADGADSPVFKFTPDSGYVVDYVNINGVSIGAPSEYQFKNVHCNYSLDVFFRPIGNVTQYTITATAGPGGNISPSGAVKVVKGASQSFTITANSGFKIANVNVDGSNVVTSPSSPYVYTFSDVQADHTINATFITATYTITATAGPNGSINPSGAVAVNAGASQSFTITANTGYAIESVIVDGSPVTFSASPFTYTFPAVSADHTISCTFKVATFTISVDHSFKGHTVPGTGTYTVNYGGSLTIQNVPDANCQVDYVNVDGNGVGAPTSYTFYNVTKNYTYYCAFKDNPPPPQRWYVVVEEQYLLNNEDAGRGYWDSGYDNGNWADIYFYHEHPTKPGYTLKRVLVDGIDKPLDGSGGYRFSMQMFQNHNITVVYEKFD